MLKFSGVLCLYLVAAAPGVDLSREEFVAVAQYRALKGNPKNQKVADAKLRAQAAKEAGLAKAGFDAALAKVEGLGAKLDAELESAIRKHALSTKVGDRVGSIAVNSSTSHVVIGVEWKQAEPADLDDEAATIAAVVKEAAPVVGTLAVWAVDGADKKVWTAKIGHAALGNFQLAKVKDFGKTRYLKLFENVRRGAAAQAEDAGNGRE